MFLHWPYAYKEMKSRHFFLLLSPFHYDTSFTDSTVFIRITIFVDISKKRCKIFEFLINLKLSLNKPFTWCKFPLVWLVRVTRRVPSLNWKFTEIVDIISYLWVECLKDQIEVIILRKRAINPSFYWCFLSPSWCFIECL